MATLGLDSIREAQQRIAGFVRPTHLIPSHTLGRLAGGPVFLKPENLQRTGSFKIRGAANRLALLTDEEKQRGIVAASAGNHGQAVALVASSMSLECTVVMPKGASVAKVQATQGYGAKVILADDAFAEALALSKQRGLTLIHPFDDPLVIAGQGTIGLEILDELPEVAQVIVPTGGGGLPAGIALAIKELRPQTRVIGVQAAAAPGVAQSVQAGSRLSVPPRPTIADGVAVAGPGELTFPLLRRYLDDVVLIDEEAIAQAIVLLLERSKLVVEGAGALGVAALNAGLLPPTDEPTVVVLSGGNIDINLLTRTAEHGLVHAGRYLSLSVGLEDKPGPLAELLALIADTEANVLEVEHQRWSPHLPIGRVRILLLLETRGPDHAAAVCAALEAGGYSESRTDNVHAQRSFLPRGWVEDVEV